MPTQTNPFHKFKVMTFDVVGTLIDFEGGMLDYLRKSGAAPSSVGDDTILDFQAKGKGQDHIDLSGHSGATSFADLEISDAGKNVVITIGEDSITLKNVNDHFIDATDFLF